LGIKEMKTKIFLIIFLVLFVFLLFKKNIEKPIIVAACPTFHYMLDELKSKGINVIETDSTAESLYYLENNKADLIISGRPLKKEEHKGYLYDIIGQGYDFVFYYEIEINEREMEDIVFYTNIDKQRIIDDFQYITEENLIEIENIEDYIKKGIVITHLEDKTEYGIVHVLNEFNRRVHLTRRPRIYYLLKTDLNQIREVEAILKEKLSGIITS
jgi:hypothetical protein